MISGRKIEFGTGFMDILSSLVGVSLEYNTLHKKYKEYTVSDYYRVKIIDISLIDELGYSGIEIRFNIIGSEFSMVKYIPKSSIAYILEDRIIIDCNDKVNREYFTFELKAIA